MSFDPASLTPRMLSILHIYVSPHSVHGLGARVIRGIAIVGTHINIRPVSHP